MVEIQKENSTDSGKLDNQPKPIQVDFGDIFGDSNNTFDSGNSPDSNSGFDGNSVFGNNAGGGFGPRGGLTSDRQSAIDTERNVTEILKNPDLPTQQKDLEVLAQKLERRAEGNAGRLKDARSSIDIHLADNYMNRSDRTAEPDKKEELRKQAVGKLKNALDLNPDVAKTWNPGAPSFMQNAIRSGAANDPEFAKKFDEASFPDLFP